MQNMFSALGMYAGPGPVVFELCVMEESQVSCTGDTSLPDYPEGDLCGLVWVYVGIDLGGGCFGMHVGIDLGGY